MRSRCSHGEVTVRSGTIWAQLDSKMAYRNRGVGGDGVGQVKIKRVSAREIKSLCQCANGGKEEREDGMAEKGGQVR